MTDLGVEDAEGELVPEMIEQYGWFQALTVDGVKLTMVICTILRCGIVHTVISPITSGLNIVQSVGQRRWSLPENGRCRPILHQHRYASVAERKIR